MIRATALHATRFLDASRERSRLGSDLPAWARELREAGAGTFAERGFPTVREEDWKYTNVSPIVERGFRPAPSDGVGRLPGSLDARLDQLELVGTRLVFVNGDIERDLSTVSGLPGRLAVGALSDQSEDLWAIAEAALGQHARNVANPFVALNTAFLQDGAVVRIPRGCAFAEPLNLIFVAAPSGEAAASHPRVLVLLESGAQATVIETYASVGDSEFFTNPVTEIVLEDGALLFHCRVLREGVSGFHVGTTQVTLGRASTFRSLNLNLGAQLGRNDLNVVFQGEGAECDLNGVYVASERQHVDNHTTIDHAVPGCTSRQLYKGILAGQATGVFNGKIIVRRDAQRTDAQQTNKNLLLSERATVDTKPQLEIFADDVRCTHGATVGPPDADTLFYLRSRGLDVDASIGLLAYGFAADVLEHGATRDVRSLLEPMVREHVDAAVRGSRST